MRDPRTTPALGDHLSKGSAELHVGEVSWHIAGEIFVDGSYTARFDHSPESWRAWAADAVVVRRSEDLPLAMHPATTDVLDHPLPWGTAL